MSVSKQFFFELADAYEQDVDIYSLDAIRVAFKNSRLLPLLDSFTQESWSDQVPHFLIMIEPLLNKEDAHA